MPWCPCNPERERGSARRSTTQAIAAKHEEQPHGEPKGRTIQDSKDMVWSMYRARASQEREATAKSTEEARQRQREVLLSPLVKRK